MGLEKIESFLGSHIEGFFNRRFSSDLEPVEMAEGLRKEIKSLARHEEGIPHVVLFTLNPQDYSRLCAKRVQDDLYAEIEREIIRAGTFMEGKLILRLSASEELKRGVFDLDFQREEAEVEEQEDTIVLRKPSLLEKNPPPGPRQHKLAALSVLEGPDEEAYLEFGEQKIYIGRKDKNEFILTDTNASRLHAWIAYERHRHVLYDARSTNGTFVNDQLVESCQLNNGDRIRIGSTLLKYEVI